MLIGHYAVALIAKRAEPKINLGTLVLAVMFADIVWCVFVIFGLEKVQFNPEWAQESISLPQTSRGATAC